VWFGQDPGPLSGPGSRQWRLENRSVGSEASLAHLRAAGFHGPFDPVAGCPRFGRSRWRWDCAAARRWASRGPTSISRRAGLTIRQALHRLDGQLRLDPVKTDASIAVLPIPDPLVTVLRAHRKRQLQERFAAGSRWRETGLVFTTSQGGFIEPRNANRIFRSLCEKANVPQLRVHDLGHSCATLLFTMGVQPATVQRILRHSSITVTTGTYVEVIEAVQRDALDSMSTLFAHAGDDSKGHCRQYCRQTAPSSLLKAEFPQWS